MVKQRKPWERMLRFFYIVEFTEDGGRRPVRWNPLTFFIILIAALMIAIGLAYGRFVRTFKDVHER